MRVVLLSGGMDSTMALIHALCDADDEVVALTFRYGQVHEIEIASARSVAKALRVRHEVIDLGGAVSVPEQPGAVVPSRNLMLLASAASWSESKRPGHKHELWIGASREDRQDFADCRKGFLEAAEECLVQSDIDVSIEAPFLHDSKLDAIDASAVKWARIGHPAGLVQFLEDETYSCYRGGRVPCGVCAACVKRREALDACDG
tara:strand:+ start:4123 stop:4734 length:612 start_codon:yes stop_codon:yes gene_type:complete